MTNKKRLHPLATVFIIATILVIVTFLVLWFIVGIQFKNDKVHEVKFLGKVVDGVPVSGRLYYYNNQVGHLNAAEKTIEIKGGDKYVGALSGYLPHGKGTLTKAGGSVFEGDFYEGYCTGNAIVSYKNGDSYIGEVDHEQREGKGEYTTSDGYVYSGNFKKNQLQGFGMTRNPNGAIHIGQYENGIKHGFGAYLFEFGDIFIGTYDKDKREGTGIYIWGKSEEFLNEFENLFDVALTPEFEKSFLAFFESGYAENFTEQGFKPSQSENPFIKGIEEILSRSQIECYIGEFSDNTLNGTGYYRWLSGRTYYGALENGAIADSASQQVAD